VKFLNLREILMGAFRDSWNALVEVVTRIPGDIKAGVREAFSRSGSERASSYVHETDRPRAVTGEHRILNYKPAPSGGWLVETDKGLVPEDRADLRL
jgi:hypothetical protein